MEEGWSTTTSAKGPLGFRRHCFGSNCFSCHYIDQSVMGESLITSTSQQQAYTSFHRFWFMIRNRQKCSQSRKLNQSWENLISLDQKTWFFLSSLIHKVFTCAQLKPPLFCTSFFSVSAFFFACIFDTFLPFVLVFPLAALYRFFEVPPFSPVHNNKKALCVFYIFCCHPASLEIRGPFFMHGFPQCQLPTHLWIQQSMKEGWENQV